MDLINNYLHALNNNSAYDFNFEHIYRNTFIFARTDLGKQNTYLFNNCVLQVNNYNVQKKYYSWKYITW